MRRTQMIFLPIIVLTLLLQGCFRPRTDEETGQNLETAATLQATADLSDLDACISGIWIMDAYALQNKFLDLNVSPYMLVIAPSQLTAEFRDDNTFSLFGMITMRMEIPNSSDYMELDGTHSASGTYEADGRTITFAGVVNEVQYGTMRMYIDGELQEGLFAPPDASGAPPIAPPVFELLTNSEYQCNETQLILQYAVPTSGSVTEEWLRAGETP